MAIRKKNLLKLIDLGIGEGCHVKYKIPLENYIQLLLQIRPQNLISLQKTWGLEGIIHNGSVEGGKIYMLPNTPRGRDAISYQMQDTLKSIRVISP